MLQVHGVNHETMDCFDKNIILPVAEYYGLDYHYFLINAYKVCYVPVQEGSLLRNSFLDFGSRSRRESMDIWKSVYQLNYEWIDKSDNVDGDCVLNRIMETISNENPVSATLDSFYCPWNEYYQQLHALHSILLIGVDQDKKEFYCIDTYLSNEVQRIDFNTIKNVYEWIILFQGSELRKSTYSHDRICSLMDSSYHCLQADEFLEPFNELKKDILSYEYNSEIDEELYLDINQSIFFTRLTALSWSRQNFADVLIHFSKLDEKIDFKGIEDIMNLSRLWIRIRNRMVKLIICGKNGESVFSSMEKKIDEAIQLEEETYKKFKEYWRKQNGKQN